MTQDMQDDQMMLVPHMFELWEVRVGALACSEDKVQLVKLSESC